MLKTKSGHRIRVIQLGTLPVSSHYYMHKIDLVCKKIIHQFIDQLYIFYGDNIIHLHITIHGFTFTFKTKIRKFNGLSLRLDG